MASFASEVKNELSRIFYEKECCKKAELTALLRLSGSLFTNDAGVFGIKFTSNNAAVARKTLSLVREVNPNIPAKVSKEKSLKLRKRPGYNIIISPSNESQKLLNSLGFVTLEGFSIERENHSLRKICCQKAYLRGAFLATGSVNKPEAEYHLELSTISQTFAKFLLDIMKKLDFPAKMTDRKEEYVVYLKEGEAILDFLGMMQADFAAERFEAARNLKEVRSQVNRIVNCETANLSKTVAASLKQIESIKRLKKLNILDTLKIELQETAKARLDNPELSLSELAALLSVSKSALTHRMKKLNELAKNYQ